MRDLPEWRHHVPPRSPSRPRRKRTRIAAVRRASRAARKIPRRRARAHAGARPRAPRDAENGGLTEKGNYNPINVEEYSRLTLEYAVEITDRSLAGQSIHNTVTVNSDENIPKDTDETVPVDGPSLDITKESDKAEYLVGETGVYKLTVRELREGVTAKQIVIKDSFDTDGAVILMDTLTVKMNGKEIDGAKISEQPNGFLIETGQDMTVEDKIEVTYRVLFESPSLDGKYVVNTDIIN